jgi:hypothetical protein
MLHAVDLLNKNHERGIIVKRKRTEWKTLCLKENQNFTIKTIL